MIDLKKTNTIRFSFLVDDVSSLFYTFCEDLIEHTRELPSGENGYQIIINRYYQWKKLKVKKKKELLSESEIMGLIGEVLFLRDELIPLVGDDKALFSWSGQELTHKDFSYDDIWYEVKTISSGKQSVRISSLDQLDSDIDGQLVVYSLEKMSEAFDGVTLNKLVLDVMNCFESQENKDSFINKVSAHGYEYNDYYERFVYAVSGLYRYSVNPDFPKLTHAMMPNAITKANYEIDISLLSKFLIERK